MSIEEEHEMVERSGAQRALDDIRARMGKRLAEHHTDGEAAVILGEVRIVERYLRRLEAAGDLVSAACSYCRASPGDPYLDDGTLWEVLESAYENYRLALRSLDDED